MNKLYRVDEANFWRMERYELNSAVMETTPENLLHLLDIEEKYGIDDLAEGCKSYGLRPSAWEYMWKGLHEGLNDLFQVSWVPQAFTHTSNLISYPLKLETDWRWQVADYFPQELFYITDSGKQGFSMDWPVTVSVVLLSLELNPCRVYHFIKSCAKATKWINTSGRRPDMRFPQIRDPEKAYRLITAPILLKELAE